MVDDLDQFTDDDCAPSAADPMASWTDEQFFRAAALLAYSAQIEDDEAHYRAPNYDL